MAWWSALAAAALGAAASYAGAPALGPAVVVASATFLFARACMTGREASPARLVALPALAALLALATATLPLATPVAMASAATLLQVGLAWMGRERIRDARKWGRRLLPLTGHASVVTGSLVTLVPGGEGAAVALLAYAGGFGVLAVHALWSHRLDAQDPEKAAGNAESAELLLLASIVVAVLAATYAYIASTALFGWMSGTQTVATAVALGAGVLGLAALASPPLFPVRGAPARANGTRLVLAHGVASLGLLNVLFVLLAIVATWSARFFIAVVTVYVAFAVGMEYRAIRRARRARALFHEPPPEWPPEAPVTVLIAARDEAMILARSLEVNLLLPERFRFLLVPSAGSTDETVAVARAAEQASPGRVRVLLGTAGSKAGDLNLAWRHLDTDVVLMLDADETITAEDARWGLATLEARGDAAVVQGRKVSRAPDSGWLARLIVTERRHATGLDQVMHAELGSTHFAGSAAFVRRSVVDELGGWTEETMTEDIEFTLRLHLGSRWRILYEPRMAVEEADPASIHALLQQRTRWARGWTQCFALYFGEVVDARARLGRARAFGLAWLLLMSVSAPIMALLPAFLLMRGVGIPSLLPYVIAVAVAAFILPARLVGYGYSALFDPHIPIPRRATRLAETLGYAYAWILLGWILSFHALYLELSSAPRVWYVTRKRADLTAPLARSRSAKGVWS